MGADGKPRTHGHVDFKYVTLAGVLPAGKSWPAFELKEVVSDADDKAYDTWVARASALAFTNIRIAVAEKVRRHAPDCLAGGCVGGRWGTGCYWQIVCGSDVTGQHGRHFQLQHLSGVLISYRQLLVAEFASRNCACMSVNGAKSVLCVGHCGCLSLRCGVEAFRAFAQSLCLARCPTDILKFAN